MVFCASLARRQPRSVLRHLIGRAYHHIPHHPSRMTTHTMTLAKRSMDLNRLVSEHKLEPNVYTELLANESNGTKYDVDALLARAEEGHLSLVNALSFELSDAILNGETDESVTTMTTTYNDYVTHMDGFVHEIHRKQVITVSNTISTRSLGYVVMPASSAAATTSHKVTLHQPGHPEHSTYELSGATPGDCRSVIAALSEFGQGVPQLDMPFTQKPAYCPGRASPRPWLDRDSQKSWESSSSSSSSSSPSSSSSSSSWGILDAPLEGVAAPSSGESAPSSDESVESEARGYKAPVTACFQPAEEPELKWGSSWSDWGPAPQVPAPRPAPQVLASRVVGAQSVHKSSCGDDDRQEKRRLRRIRINKVLVRACS